MYAKLPNFVELPPTFTKLCDIKDHHLVNFYISVGKHKNCDISATV